MATKPAPRRASTLAGQHPVGPGASDNPTTEQPARRTATPPAGVTHARAVTTTKATFTVDAGVIDAAKNAFWASRNAGQHRTFSDFVNDALRQLTVQLQDQLNDGAAFQKRPTTNLPPGRVAD